MNKTPDFSTAKHLATLVLQFTSLAELYTKDYEAELYKQGFESRQAAKKMITDNARVAHSLHLSLMRLENTLLQKISEAEQDDFLDDVGFLHEMCLLITDRCGANETKRTMVRAAIFNIKSELNIC